MARTTSKATAGWLVVAITWSAACSALNPSDPGYSARPVLTERGTEVGVASWYGPGFDGRLTASGEIYDQDALTAAHRSLPLGTQVRVTELASGRSLTLRINDRGPYKKGRIIDLSRAAAIKLGIIDKGTARVEISVLGDHHERWPVTYYSVQIGAFASREAADRAGRAAAHRGENAYLQVSEPERGSHFRVRVGPFRNRREAVRAAARLKHGGFDPVVVEESEAVARYFERRSRQRSADLGASQNNRR